MALGDGAGLLLPALAQCAGDHRVPSCRTCTPEQELPLCKPNARVLHSVPPVAGRSSARRRLHEERFDELVEDLLAPAPIGVEGSWQVLDATSSAQATVLCMFCRFCQAGDVYAGALGPMAAISDCRCESAQACQTVMPIPQVLALSASQ